MGWGEGAGAFAESFLKGYQTFQQNDRANAEAERLKAAQAMELERSKQLSAIVQRIIDAQQKKKNGQTGFLETPTGEPVNSNLKPFEVTLPAGTPDSQVQQVASGLTNKQIPIPQVGAGQFGMLSGEDDLKQLYLQAAAIYPEKFLPLLQKDDSGYDKLMAQMLIAQMRNNVTREGYTSREGIAAENNALRKAIEAMRDARGNAGQDNKDRQYASNLRKEYNNLPEIKEGNSVQPKILSMEKAYAESLKTNNFVAVDQALITLFNKLTDPTSVVRESEYARTPENIPYFNAIKGKANKILEGGAGLTQAERNALIKMARDMNKGYSELRQKRAGEYRGYANLSGLNGDEIINDTYLKGDTPSTGKQRFVIKAVK
jgi:hypothetical protein